MAAVDSKLQTTATILSLKTSVSKYIPNLLPVLLELGKSTARMARQPNQVVFFRACVEACALNELKFFLKDSQMAALLLNYKIEHIVSIYMPRGVNSL